MTSRSELRCGDVPSGPHPCTSGVQRSLCCAGTALPGHQAACAFKNL